MAKWWYLPKTAYPTVTSAVLERTREGPIGRLSLCHSTSRTLGLPWRSAIPSAVDPPIDQLGTHVEGKASIHCSGPSRVTSRRVLAMSIPTMLAYLTTPLLGFVHTAVVGQFGDAAALGGLAAGADVVGVVIATFTFLRSGTSSLVAQASGRGDVHEERAVFWRAVVMAAILGLALVLLAPLIAATGEWFLNAEQHVADAMDLYIRTRLISAPLTLINYAILGYFLGRGKAGIGLFLQLVLNGMNMAFAILLGLYLDCGIAGVCWGCLGGEVAAMIAGMMIFFGGFRISPKMPHRKTFNIAAMKKALRLNGDIMMRSFVLMGAFILFTRQAAQIGTLTLAANAVLLNVVLLSTYIHEGFAATAQQLAGQAISAHDRPAFLRAATLTTGWGFTVASFTNILMFAFGEPLIGTITEVAEVRAEAIVYLPWAAFAAFSGVLAFQLNGVFLGATWTRDMRNTMLISFAAFIPSLFTLGQLFGNHGLWAALHVFLLLRGISLLWVIRRCIRSAFDK